MSDNQNRRKEPAHPGGFVKHEVLKPHGLSVTEAADALGVTRPALSALLNERAQLSPEMAIRIEKAFGVSMETLMRMQNSYDIAQARARAVEIKVMPFKGKAPDRQSAQEAGATNANESGAHKSAQGDIE
jgi:addiction module HigA family antidote